MSNTPSAQSVGVPRLQELHFLREALKLVGAGATYEDIRVGLIAWMEARREGAAASGRFMGIRRKPGVGGRHDTRFVDNTSESLAELMRVGWIERATLPTTAGALPGYRARRFALTSGGEDWLAQLRADPEMAIDALLDAVWRVHPQLRGYYGLLGERGVVIPAMNWTDLFVDGVDQFGDKERQRYVDELARRVIDADRQSDLGWKPGGFERVRTALQTVGSKRTERARRQSKPFPYVRAQDFTRDCHKSLVGFAFEQAGVKLDFTTHEILRRWGRDFGVAGFSYHVPHAISALRCWGTAVLDEDSGVLVTTRRRVSDYGDQVVADLPTAYEDAKRIQGGGGFVPVYALRELICWQFGLNGSVFDRAVRDVLEGRRHVPFRIIPDRGYAGKVPPTEAPLLLRDSHGRESAYLLMTLTPTERTPR
jgi:hypothetical protein